MHQYETLTERQQKILATVRACRARGYVPSYREICESTDIKSVATVHRELKFLHAMQVVRLQEGQRRVIELPYEPPPIPVPLLGRIAAGRPIAAEENVEARYALPPDLVGTGDLFMLQVRGDSMIEAKVLDGDYVVVRRQPVAENGEMVAALLDRDEPEATVKIWSLDEEHGRATLQPANPAYEPIDGSHATILGKVIAVVRPLR